MAFVFNTGTTPTCIVTGSVVRLLLYLRRLVGGSPRISPCVGIIVIRGCGMDTTRGLVPTYSVSRRVSLTSGRTDKAKGVGFVLGNTMALKAVSNTGIRVDRLMNGSGVCVFKRSDRRIVRRCRGTSCYSESFCRGSRHVHHTMSFVMKGRLLSVKDRRRLEELRRRVMDGS